MQNNWVLRHYRKYKQDSTNPSIVRVQFTMSSDTIDNSTAIELQKKNKLTGFLIHS